MNGMEIILAIIVGLAGGLAVGSGFVAFITLLDIIPRLAQVTRIQRTSYFEAAVVLGVIAFTTLDFYPFQFSLSTTWLIWIGLCCGVFVGMLAAALTEVLNVFPILAKRLHLSPYIIWLLFAMVFGKVMGTFFDWVIFQRME